jgi:outer membrane protein assembly factor BamD (BamD/ComL family)
MKIKICLIVFSLVFFSSGALLAEGEGEIYSAARAAAKAGDTDAAFMGFRSLLTDYPGSKYTADSLFASGEYFFLTGNYKEAVSAFTRFINEYPDSKPRLFAIMYLYKIAKKQENESLLENLKKEIIDFQQLILLFRDFKEYKYSSPLQKKYRAVYYIDKAEFYLNGELFEEILF